MNRILFNRTVKRIIGWQAIACLTVLLASCSSQDNEKILSPEELRLERATRIDSVAISSVLQPDSIAEQELLNSITAEAWILVEDSMGLLLSEKNADERLFPASLTKMMTCLLALEHGNMADTLEITEDVFVTRDSRVRPGDRYEVGILLNEMMLQSDNVAAVALAKHLSPDTLSFTDMMNSKAAYLHMDSTHFANPNGMPNDSNYSTARDLLTLTRYCMYDSAFAQIVSTPFMDVPLIDKRHFPCTNTNLLLTDYEGCIGVKTGYTRQAGACLASAATRNGVTLYLVMLKSKTRASRFTESALLLDYGFRQVAAYREQMATE